MMMIVIQVSIAVLIVTFIVHMFWLYREAKSPWVTGHWPEADKYCDDMIEMMKNRMEAARAAEKPGDEQS